MDGRRWLLVVWGVVAAACPAATSHAGDQNSLMELSRDGRLLACSNRDSGTVTIVRTDDLTKAFELPVGLHPEGVTFLGDSHRLAVAVYGDDRIVLIDADAGREIARTEVEDEPYGLVASRDGRRLFVTLDYPGRVVELDAATLAERRSFEVGPFARGLGLAPDESRLFVSLYYSGDVVAVATADGRVVDRWPGVSNDNLARKIVVHPTRPKLYLPHVRSRVTAVHGEGSIFPYVSVVDSAPGEGKRRRRLPMDGFLGNLVPSNPWDAAISPDGRRFYVVFAGTDDLFDCEVVDDDYRELNGRRRLALGSNPRAVCVSPDGRRLYVYQALDFNVAVFDTDGLQKVGAVSVTDNPLGEERLRGKRLFYSALPPIVGRRWISCASCHPDGDPDGRTWSNPEGPRNTQSLAGLAWTHPVHWSADRDEVQDFEHTIRGPLMQGRGLIAGEVAPDLGPPNKGRSADLDAVAAYTNSHRLTLSPHAKRGLSPAARRGQTLFHSERLRCAVCHTGPFYTDSRPDKPVKHDVGTVGDDPTEKLGKEFDTPSLLGVYRTAPYLHHGRATTLRDVLTTANPDDRHGATSGLQPQELDDLVEFLKSLPFEDPQPEAVRRGLPKIER